MSKYAPRMESMKIAVDKIGAVIGPGGKTIRGIVEETGATVDIQDDGTIVIGSSDGNASERAKQMIRDLTKEIEIGEIYTGKVVRTTDFGAFIELVPGKDGMVHISELANYRVPTVEDEVNVGDEVNVLVTEVDQTGRVRLSRRALLSDAGEDGEDPVEAALRRQRAGRGGGQRRGGGGGFGGDRGPRRDGPGRGGPPRNRDRDFDGGRPRGRGDRDRDRDDSRGPGFRSQSRGGFGGGGGRDRDRGGFGGGGGRDRDRGGFGGGGGRDRDRDRGDGRRRRDRF
jgi:polyribonucleotide nucleotidyltransferase